MDFEYDLEVDARGEQPPVPTILCKDVLDRMQVGQVLKLIASYEGTSSNIRMLVSAYALELIQESRTSEGFVFYIRKTR